MIILAFMYLNHLHLVIRCLFKIDDLSWWEVIINIYLCDSFIVYGTQCSNVQLLRVECFNTVIILILTCGASNWWWTMNSWSHRHYDIIGKWIWVELDYVAHVAYYGLDNAHSTQHEMRNNQILFQHSTERENEIKDVITVWNVHTYVVKIPLLH